MKPLIRRHIIAAIVSFVLLITVLGGLGWFISTLKTREARVIEVRDRLASYEQNKRRLSEETAMLGTLRDQVSRLEQYVITEDTTPALLSSVEQMAKAQGIDFVLTAVAATSQTAVTPAKLHIDFSAEGSFASIQRFVDTLLSQPYQIKVSRLSLFLIDNAKSTGGTWQLLAGIDIMSS
jgi:Tfp pilus assembly protein PilO